MADFVALFEGEEFTSTASGTVTGGQVLEVSGSGTVAATSGASAKVVGLAAFDGVNGDKVTVLYDCIANVTASGTVTAGDQVTSAAAGKVASLAAAGVLADEAAASTAINNARSVIGLALTTATDGNPVTVRFSRS